MPAPPYRVPAERPIDPPPDEATRLGALRSTHGPAPNNRLVYTIVCIVALAMTLIAVSSSSGPCYAERRHNLLFGAGFFLVSFVVLVVLPAILRRGLRVDVHEGGVVTTLRGRRDLVVFEDVDEVWMDLEHRAGYARAWATITAMRLVEHGGREHRVRTDVVDPIAVIRAIERRCSLPLLPEARAAILAGEALSFGKVRIDRDGIAVGRSRARWKDLRLVRMMPGRVAFFRRWPVVPWRTVRFDRVPHPSVFGALVRERAIHVEVEETPGAST